MTRLYYTPPTDDQFDELKARAIEIWAVMGSETSCSEEKIGRIKHIKNIGDNFMYMVAMFDHNNQEILARTLSFETRKAVRERMIDGGQPEYLIAF